MSKVKILIIAVIILAAACIAYYLFTANKDDGPGPGFSGGNGRLEATEVDIATKMAGRIEVINVDEGDYVKPGDLLAIMQTDVLQAQLNEALAQVAKARTAEASAKAQIAVKESDVTAAQATVLQRQSELDQTQRRLRRSTVLSEEGVITGQQFDDDETTTRAAQATVATAQAQVKVAEAAVLSAKADADGAAATVKAAEASAASIIADIKDCHLTAPREGRIQYRIVQPGEVLAAGGRVLNLVDVSDVYMTFFLPAVQAGQVPLGAEARIILDAFPQAPLPATITFVASTAQFTPKTVETAEEREKLMFRVKAKVDPEYLRPFLPIVKTGLPGMAWVKLAANEPWPENMALNPERLRAAAAAVAASPTATPASAAAAAATAPATPAGSAVPANADAAVGRRQAMAQAIRWWRWPA